MSRLMRVKLLRDLRASWPRFALMVLAIGVSLTVSGGILTAWAAVGRETTGAYLSTEPASATIVLREGLAPERMAALAARVRARPAVPEAAGRTQFAGEVAAGRTARAVPLQVFAAAPDDPMRIATFGVPARVPAAGEILIRRDSLALLGVAVGDTIPVRTPGGGTVRLRVAGTVYDPSLSPSPQEQRGYGYVSTASLPRPALDQLKIQVADPGGTVPSRDRATVVTEAEAVGRWLRDQGVPVREIQVPDPYAHPHQWQSDALLGSLLAGSALALLLSAVLVATMLNALFTQQIPQIGILKAIGARSSRVAGLYLTMTLLVAGAATVLAFGPAVVLGRTLLDRLLSTLGIQAVDVAPPWWTYAAILAAGLLLPPLIALVPLVRTSRTTVRAAIDHHGGSTDPRAGGRLLARLRGLDRGLLMALRNTIRRPARFVLAVGLLAGAGTVFVAGMSLGTGTQAVEERQKAERYWDVNVRLAAPASPSAVAAALRGVPEVSGYEGWANTEAGVAPVGGIPVTRTYPDQGHGKITLDAVPMDSTLFPPPEILEGRWLRPGETGAVVLSPKVVDSTLPGAKAGDRVQLFAGGRATTWRLVGIAENREGYGVLTTPEGFAQATGGPVRVDQVRVVTAEHDEPTRIAAADATAAALRGAGLAVGSADSVSRSEAITAGHLGPIVVILIAVALPLGVIGAIGLASTMSTNVLERTREFGVMHAIGARPRAVRRIVVLEGVVLAVVSCLVAVLPTLGLTWLLGAGFGNLFMSAPLPYRISLTAAAIWTVLAIIGAVLATEAAATRASRITVREALTYI